MDKIRNKKNLIIGFLIVLIITILVHLFVKEVRFIGGIFWGFTLSYSGLLLFILLPNYKASQGVQSLSMINYLFRSIIRMSTILALFTVMVFVLKAHALGLLGGAFVGMMVLSFLFLYKMKPAQ